MSYKSIAVLGDSISNGYFDHPFGGWVQRLTAKLSLLRPHEIGMVNFSIVGDRICDMYHRFCSGVISSSPDILLIAATANDVIRFHSQDNGFSLSRETSEEYWEKLLDLATKTVSQIFIFTIPPVDESQNPLIGIFDWEYNNLNADVEGYNALIETIAHRRNIPVLNFYAPCAALPSWSTMLHDASHPNAQGHEFLAETAYNWLVNKI